MRLTGAQVTRVKALLDDYWDAHTKIETKSHEHSIQCSEECEREEEVTGAVVGHPTQVMIEDLADSIASIWLEIPRGGH